MIIIDLDEYREEEKRKKEHTPKIEIFFPDTRSDDSQTDHSNLSASAGPDSVSLSPEELQQHVTVNFNQRQKIIAELEARKAAIRKERAMLSNYYHKLMKQNASQYDFAINYRRIEAKSDELRELYDQIRDIERNGLPSDQEKQEEKQPYYNNLGELKIIIRSNVNIRNKLKKRLKEADAKGTKMSKRMEWEENLSYREAEYRELKKNEQILKAKRKAHEANEGEEA